MDFRWKFPFKKRPLTRPEPKLSASVCENFHSARRESKEESLTKKKDVDNAKSPVFVEAEKMFGRIAEITRETAQKAYDFSQNRGAALGMHLDGWFKAESEILSPTPVELTETKRKRKVRMYFVTNGGATVSAVNLPCRVKSRPKMLKPS